jgi:type II secretory pathway component PulK
MRGGSAGTRNFKEETQAHYLAVSAVEEAVAYILTDKDLTVDFIDEEGRFRTDPERPAIDGIREDDNAWLKLDMSDEESRVNVNSADGPTLQGVLSYIGVPEGLQPEMLDSLADWKDPDDLHRLSGAEDEYYSALGYKPKNMPLDSPDELLLVKGFLPEYLSGSEDIRPLRPMVSTFGEGINVNTASGDMLRALGVADVEVETIISQRSSGGLRTTPPGLAGRAVTASQNFRIEATARMYDNPQAVKITAILKRTIGPEGPSLKTVFWREEIESRGT